MAKLKDIRGRIGSIRNMAKITRAMQMVAIAKMRRAQDAALHGVPYADLLNDILIQASRHLGAGHRHGLMRQQPGGRTLAVVVGTDRGLCGALNHNLFRECLGYDAASTYYVAVGAKAAQFVQRSGRQLLVDFTYGDPPKLAEARMICRFVTQLFLDEEIGRAVIVFSDFVSTLRQEAMKMDFLPVGQLQAGFEDLPEDIRLDRLRQLAGSEKDALIFDCEPNIETMCESLLLRSLDYQMLQVLREVRASEHSARMIAMKQATDNAEDMIDQLGLAHNKLRQAAITKELLEISAATSAA